MRLTEHFTLEEFKCRCCGQYDLAPLQRLAAELELVRPDVGPMTITSGFRCKVHNANVGGAPHSFHLRGLAADIACSTHAARFRLVKSLLEHGWTRIGIAKLFVHADLGEAPQHVIWTYPK
jgi:zinc D-Ala-D-Ala carboxypeptidase